MLDEKDKLIFEHLTKDCRVSTSYLAKETRLSQATVHYRIEQLEKKAYIEKYDAIINHNLLNGEERLYFVSVSQNMEEGFEKKIEAFACVVSCFKVSKKENYILLTIIESQEEREELESFLNSYSYHSHFLTYLHTFPHSFFDLKIKEKRKTKVEEKKLSLDKLDAQLIQKLANGHARDSLLSLSQELGVNYEHLLYRFKRLKKAGYFALFIAQPGQERFTLNPDMFLFKTKKKLSKK
jgi:DNA-binding Lrp family transcriptional regulator